MAYVARASVMPRAWAADGISGVDVDISIIVSLPQPISTGENTAQPPPSVQPSFLPQHHLLGALEIRTIPTCYHNTSAAFRHLSFRGPPPSWIYLSPDH